MKKVSLTIAMFALIFASSCKTENKKDADTTAADQMEQEQDVSDEKSKITLTKMQGSPKFDDAALSMTKPTKDQVAAGEVEFQFDVENYELGIPTETDSDLGIAESKKGQHVHFIVDNNPYSAHYEDSFTKNLEEGDHTVLAFLSRSYHEAVKNKNAYVIKKLSVGDVSEENKLDVDFSAPHMFYSRPKGTYSGKDTQKVMLDFYLLNTDLSDGGNKVKATINGEEFMITEWTPYVMEGLPMGENTVQLELLDADNNRVESPYNPVTRTFTLEK